jgi:hypothetical protein
MTVELQHELRSLVTLSVESREGSVVTERCLRPKVAMADETRRLCKSTQVFKSAAKEGEHQIDLRLNGLYFGKAAGRPKGNRVGPNCTGCGKHAE